VSDTAGMHMAEEVETPVAQDTHDVLDMITGSWVSQITGAIAVLHIPDHLAEGARTADEIARLEGSEPRATFRLMRAASSVGLLKYLGQNRFGLSGRGQLLRSGVPGSLREMAMIQTAHAQWQCWGLLPDAVREGRSQATRALGADLFAYFAKDENAGEAALFAQAMGNLSGLIVGRAATMVDTSYVSDVVDVGGSNGDFVLGLMESNPVLRGQVVDLPHVVAGAEQEARRRGLSDRFSAVAGDFFVAVPAADLYLLKLVLHDWDDEDCVQILRNCRSSARPNGRVLIVERVIGQVGEPDFATRADINMLIACEGGMERDIHEFDVLLSASGWRRSEAHAVGAHYHLLIAQAC
jgi:O-methyltransferase domain